MADLLKAIAGTFRVLSERLGFTISKMDPDLYRACMECNLDNLKAKLDESPFTILKRTPDGDTLLHICVGEGDTLAVRRIAQCYELSAPWIRMWPLIQVKNSRGNTVLHEAAIQGNTEMVELLLQLNKELTNKRNSNGETALFLACENGTATAVEAILSSESSSTRMLGIPSKDGQNCLHIAAYKGRREMLGLIEQKDKEGMLKYLEKCDDSGATPLHCAAEGGHSEAAGFLARCKPDVCYKYDKLRRCPIHVAAIRGNAATIKAITNVVPDCIRMLSKCGRTILHYAVENDHIDLVQWLSEQMQYKLRGDERDKKGNQPLHLAARNGIDETMLRTLIERYPRVQVNGRNREGFRAVDLIYSGARSKESVSKAKGYLQSAGAMVGHDEGSPEEGINASERESRSQRNSRMMDISALIAALIATVAASGTLQISSNSVCVGNQSSSTTEYYDCKGYTFSVGMYVVANSIAFFSAVTVLLVWVVMEVSWRHTERPWLKSSIAVLALSLVAMCLAFTLATGIGTWGLNQNPEFLSFAVLVPALVVPLVILAWIITDMWVWCGRAKHERRARIKRLFKHARCRLIPSIILLLCVGMVFIYFSLI